MANGKIKQQSNTFLQGNASKTIAKQTDTAVTTISLPAGQWLVISQMYLSASGSDIYNHGLGNLTVRTSEKNGGGSLNARVLAGPVDIDIKCYHYIASGCTAYVYWWAIKLL